MVVRRGDGQPVVICNAPLLDDGRPMPTRFWLVDPELRDAVSRLEAAGAVRAAAAAVDPLSLAEAHARYSAERDSALPPGHAGPKPSGGVGGTRQGVKCLHAHLAWFLAGGDDPVGRYTAAALVDTLGSVLGPPRAVAAIDCGTNSTRLLVVGPDATVLDRQMHITRLGQGVDATGRLADDAVARTVDVLVGYRRRMDELGVDRVRLVATSAARDATNAAVFLDAARRATGVEPEVLTGDEEGRLSFAGATTGLVPAPGGSGPVVVVDIGGGSTELVVGTPGRPATAQAVSIDMGCVRITERFLAHDPPTAGELQQAGQAVEAALDRACRSLPPVPSGGTLVGLAGTVSTLAALQGQVTHYDRDLIHHQVLTDAAIATWLEVLAADTAQQRLERPGMVEGRVDVIVGGVLVLQRVMEAFGARACLVSEDDILDGMVAALLGQGGG